MRTANYDSHTVWHILAKLDQLDCVTLLANTLPAAMLLTALLQIDADDQTAFNVAANENLDCLAMMLDFLPFDLRLSALLTSNHDGDNSLHLAARHMDAACLALMLNSLPHNLRLQPLMTNNDYGETVMLLVLDRFDEASLITIMNSLLEEQRLLMVLQEKDKNDQCFLQHAVSYGRKDLLSLLFHYLPKQQLVTALQEKDACGTSLLQDLLKLVNKDCFGCMLKALPENQRLAALLEQTENGDMMLNVIAYSNRTAMLNSLTASERHFAEIMLQDDSGVTILFKVCSDTLALDRILQSLPEAMRLLALVGFKRRHANGVTVLHHSAGNPGTLSQITGLPVSLAVMLNSLPVDSRVTAVLAKDRYGDTVLHYACVNPQSMTAILNSLPQEKLQDVLMTCNDDGHSVFHQDYAGSRADSLLAIFNTLPQEISFQLLQTYPEDILREDIDFSMNDAYLSALHSGDLLRVLKDILLNKINSLAQTRCPSFFAWFNHLVSNDPLVDIKTVVIQAQSIFELKKSLVVLTGQIDWYAMQAQQTEAHQLTDHQDIQAITRKLR